MAGSSPRGKGPIADINVTPLVDVILVLLIIFMVTTEVIQEDDKAIAIELPVAAASDNKQFTPYTVVVTKEGKYLQDGQPVTEEEVIATARELVATKGAEAEAVVAADQAATHQKFVRLLDVLRQAGISRFAIQTDVPE